MICKYCTNECKLISERSNPTFDFWKCGKCEVIFKEWKVK